MYALFMDVMFYVGGIQETILCCVETTFAFVSISGIVAGPTVWQWLLGAALRSTPPRCFPPAKHGWDANLLCFYAADGRWEADSSLLPCGKTRVGSWLISGPLRVISGPLMNESCSIRGGIAILLWMACHVLVRIGSDVFVGRHFPAHTTMPLMSLNGTMIHCWSSVAH